MTFDDEGIVDQCTSRKAGFVLLFYFLSSEPRHSGCLSSAEADAQKAQMRATGWNNQVSESTRTEAPGCRGREQLAVFVQIAAIVHFIQTVMSGYLGLLSCRGKEGTSNW